MENKIKALLIASGLSEVPASRDESLAGYGLDSLTVVLFVVELEKTLGIKIDPNDAMIENFATISTIEALISKASRT